MYQVRVWGWIMRMRMMKQEFAVENMKWYLTLLIQLVHQMQRKLLSQYKLEFLSAWIRVVTEEWRAKGEKMWWFESWETQSNNYLEERATKIIKGQSIYSGVQMVGSSTAE